MIEKKKVITLAVDIDVKIHLSDNEEAEMTYKKQKGYGPLYVIMLDYKLVYDVEFRKGSVAPQEGNKEAAGMVMDNLPKSVRTVRFRFDASGWQTEVLRTIEGRNETEEHGRRHEFFVRPANHGNKDGLGDVEREVRAIGSEDWRPYGISLEEKKKGSCREQWEIAETVKTIGEGKSMLVFRMVVVRKPADENSKQGRLFDGEYNYSAIVTNNESSSGEEVHEFYNGRGAAEDIIGEIVEDGRCERFPMKRDDANSFMVSAGGDASQPCSDDEDSGLAGKPAQSYTENAKAQVA